MGVWGMSLEDASRLTERQVNLLLNAYVQRKKFEAKVTLSLLAEAMKPKEEKMSLSSLAAMGFGIRGA
jgi:hypothetical protein